MDFELKKSKRDKSSIVPIEEVYTDLDIKENDPHDPSIGFRFDTPRRWAQDKSKSKSIGIRDLKLTPSSGDIRCRFVHVIGGFIETYTATWDTDHYEIDESHPTRNALTAKYYASNDVVENITPNNGFEEIITDILFNKLNGSAWKQIRKENGSTKNYYFTYAATNDTLTRPLYFGDSANYYILNKNFLPVPTSFLYRYDSNTCSLDVVADDFLRTIYMSDHSTLSSIEEHSQISLSKNSGYWQFEELESATSQKSETVDGSPVAASKAYLPEPYLCNSELLMIVRKDDETSLKNIYSLFNQRLPDNLDSLAKINLDRKDYYVPFVYKVGDNSYVNQQGTPYTSYFCFNNKAANRSPDVDTDVDITNLNLSNVWDRIHLIYHASFAETRMRIIGRNNDHWDSPNKRFIVPGSDQDEFYLRFTTDGKHPILPIGCHFNCDLCFMLNTSNNLATGIGNHDMFK